MLAKPDPAVAAPAFAALKPGYDTEAQPARLGLRQTPAPGQGRRAIFKALAAIQQQRFLSNFLQCLSVSKEFVRFKGTGQLANGAAEVSRPSRPEKNARGLPWRFPNIRF
jgi:hypothetical protein